MFNKFRSFDDGLDSCVTSVYRKPIAADGAPTTWLRHPMYVDGHLTVHLSILLQAELSQKRLGRAGKLTALLGNEVGRWEETTAQITQQLAMLVGDAFLSAACVSYYGAFTG